MAPVHAFRVMGEVVVGRLMQPAQLKLGGGSPGEIGVESDGLGVLAGAPWLVDDATIHALNDQEPVRESLNFYPTAMRIA